MNQAPTADGGPGFLAFLAFFLLALALWFLMRNMNARMRRMSYRQQAAHRGKGDPQAAPGELATEGDGTVGGSTARIRGEADPGVLDGHDDAGGTSGTEPEEPGEKDGLTEQDGPAAGH